MKKFLVLVLALVLVLGAIPVSAITAKGSFGEVPLYKGTITVDGKKDAIYDKALKINTQPFNDASKGDSSAVVSLLHDGSNVYVLVECKSAYPLGDYNQTYAGGNSWNTTGLEVLFDWTNKAASQSDCWKYRTWFTGEIWYSLKSAAGDADYKVTVDKNAKTFTAEFKFGFKEGVKTGSEVGFNLMYDSDKTMGASSNATRTIAGITPGVDNNGSLFKNITFSAKEVQADAPKTTTTAASATTAPKTADASALLVLAAAAACAGCVYTRKH